MLIDLLVEVGQVVNVIILVLALLDKNIISQGIKIIKQHMDL